MYCVRKFAQQQDLGCAALGIDTLPYQPSNKASLLALLDLPNFPYCLSCYDCEYPALTEL